MGYPNIPAKPTTEARKVEQTAAEADDLECVPCQMLRFVMGPALQYLRPYAYLTAIDFEIMGNTEEVRFFYGREQFRLRGKGLMTLVKDAADHYLEFVGPPGAIPGLSIDTIELVPPPKEEEDE